MLSLHSPLWYPLYIIGLNVFQNILTTKKDDLYKTAVLNAPLPEVTKFAKLTQDMS